MRGGGGSGGGGGGSGGVLEILSSQLGRQTSSVIWHRVLGGFGTISNVCEVGIWTGSIFEHTGSAESCENNHYIDVELGWTHRKNIQKSIKQKIPWKKAKRWGYEMSPTENFPGKLTISSIARQNFVTKRNRSSIVNT